MKLYEIPINTLVELQFFYLEERHMISAGLLYKYADTVYVSAVKTAGKTISAKKLRDFKVYYKTDASVYSFTNLSPRSISYNGQNLYAIQTSQDARLIKRLTAYRLFIGAPICARITSEGVTRQINCILKDISMTGMGILSLKKIDEHAKIEISFRVRENQPEVLTASITHSREFKSGNGYLYGCEFDVPNESIGNYVMRRRAQLSEDDENKNQEE